VRITILYDGAAAGAAPADVAGVLEAVTAVAAVLEREGHRVTRLPAASPLERLLPALSVSDLVVNLAEGLDGRAEGEARLVALLELAGVPFTGSGSETLALCRRKDRANAVLAAAGLPVPAWAVATPGRVPDWVAFPAIVKPVGEDGSVGIAESSVVEDPVQLAAALAQVDRDALVQEFVAGRELNAALVGDAVLPISEIRFSGAVRVVTYAAKWAYGSPDDLATRPVCPARLPAGLRDRVLELATAAWVAVGGRGYGRVDVRLDPDDRPWILEVNPNPDLAPGAGLARMAGAAGWGYDGLVRRIVGAARP
jgi:D-alanine-D-alanine ligase